jgi:hypothetical protein
MALAKSQVSRLDRLCQLSRIDEQRCIKVARLGNRAVLLNGKVLN